MLSLFKNLGKTARVGLPLLFLPLGAWGLEHRNPIDAVTDGVHWLSGGVIGKLRPPPPDRHMAYPYVSDTPSYQPDLPTPAARVSLTHQLEAQRNAAQRWGVASGGLIGPGYTAPPPIPQVIFDKHGRPIRTVIKDMSYDYTVDPNNPDAPVSPADALNADFMQKIKLEENAEEQKLTDAQKEKRHIAQLNAKIHPEQIPFIDGIYWPWTPLLSHDSGTVKTKPKKAKPSIMWPQKPLPLPPLLYETHDLSPPRSDQLPIVPPAPPQPHSAKDFEIPDQAPNYVPDLDYANPKGILVRFEDQSDELSSQQGEAFDKILSERHGRKVKIVGYGGTFDTHLGLTPADQIREINFGILRAKAVGRQLRALGISSDDMILSGAPIGDGARVSFIDED